MDFWVVQFGFSVNLPVVKKGCRGGQSFVFVCQWLQGWRKVHFDLNLFSAEPSRVLSVLPTSVSRRRKLAKDDCNELITIARADTWARPEPMPEMLLATQNSAGLICGYRRDETSPVADAQTSASVAMTVSILRLSGPSCYGCASLPKVTSGCGRVELQKSIWPGQGSRILLRHWICNDSYKSFWLWLFPRVKSTF